MCIKPISRFLSMAILILILCSHGPAQDLTDPYEIITRHYETHGGLERLKNTRTTYIEGTLTLGTLSGPIKQWDQMPDKGRAEIDLGIIRQTSGDNGEISWEVDANGKVQIIKNKYVMQRREIGKAYALFEQLNRDSKIFSLTFNGIEEVNGKMCYVVKVTNSINDDYRVGYFDIENFQLLKTVESTPDEIRTTDYSDFRDIDGRTVAFRHHIVLQPTGQEMTMVLTKFEADRAFDRKIFDPPEEDVKDYHFTAGGNFDEVPVKYIENHIFVPVRINGRECLWVLDTGAEMSVIDSAFAVSLGLEPQGGVTARGAGNTLEVQFIKAPSYDVGNVEMTEQTIIVSSFVNNYCYRFFGLDVCGILGYDFLSRFVTRIDYAGETLTFFEPAEFEYEGPGKVVEAPLMGNSFTVPVTVDDKLAGDWFFDCGAGGCSFHYPFAESNDLLDLNGVEGLSFGAGGSFHRRLVKFDRADIAGFTVENPIISVPQTKGSGGFSSGDLAGNLGNDVFEKFVIYLDYAAQRIILEKGPLYDVFKPKDRSGLQLVNNDDRRCEVAYVSADTPAASSGFMMGDVLTAINGTPIEDIGDLPAIREMLRAEPGISYNITFERNGNLNEARLILKELY